jgi:hypothetical protein
LYYPENLPYDESCRVVCRRRHPTVSPIPISTLRPSACRRNRCSQYFRRVNRWIIHPPRAVKYSCVSGDFWRVVGRSRFVFQVIFWRVKYYWIRPAVFLRLFVWLGTPTLSRALAPLAPLVPPPTKWELPPPLQSNRVSQQPGTCHHAQPLSEWLS